MKECELIKGGQTFGLLVVTLTTINKLSVAFEQLRVTDGQSLVRLQKIKLQKIVGNLLDKLRKLYMKGTFI